MTEENKAVVVADGQVVDLAEWRSREEIAVMGKRIQAYVPGCDKLTDMQAYAFGQYCLVMDVNPFRGDVYAYPDSSGRLVITDGYKALVRWARGRHPFTHRFTPAPGIPEGAIGYRCYVLRQDAREAMQDFISMGAEFKEAYELCAVFADGIVGPGEMSGRQQPPKGWSWDERARTRALKNTLNKSHGAPSPKEVSSGSWNVHGTHTQPEDWQAVTPGMSGVEAEAVAEYGAMVREAHEHANDVTAPTATDELYGDYVSDGDQPLEAEIIMEDALAKLDEIAAAEKMNETPPEIEPKQSAVVWTSNPDVLRGFWAWVDRQRIDEKKIGKAKIHEMLGVESLKDYQGTVGDAKQAIADGIKAKAN